MADPSDTRGGGSPRAIKRIRNRSKENMQRKRKVFDWISHPENVDGKISPFQRFILDVDWERSPLGLMKDWPTQLRQMVLLVVQDPAPAGTYYFFLVERDR